VELRGARPAAALLALALLVAWALAAPPAASGADLTSPRSLTRPPAGFELTGRDAIRIADRVPEVRRERRERRLEPSAFTRGAGRWQISYFAGDREVVQVLVGDNSGNVLEVWTGHQVAWRMARGYEGAFGRTFNAPWVWLPLGLLFLLPFVDPRRPLRLVHLDVLVLCAFAVSHVFFNRGEIGVSVPLVYPVLAYLLARLLFAGLRPRPRRERLVPHVPIAWLAIALVFLVGFRATLNVVDSNVIDVGYASVVGADRIVDGDALYGEGFPEPRQHGDTYGPLTYLAYVPFEQALPWSGAWDDLPAAHAAAIAFDLLTILGLLLVGRRLRPGRAGRELGVVLAYAWTAYPYTLFVLSTNANDGLVALLAVGALLAVTGRRGGGALRGALAGLGAAAKLAPAILAPLLAAGTGERRWRALAGGALAGTLVLVALYGPFVPDGGVRELYDRTIGYQAGRDAPFSVWGQEPSLEPVQAALITLVGLLALAFAFVPRRRDARQVAALAGALVVGAQLTLDYWFYLYVAWFAPFAFVALLAGRTGEEEPEGAERPADAVEERPLAAAPA
jgi:hypothetical protein